MNEVRVTRKAADRVAGGHPWIFTSDVVARGDAQPGQPVKVADPRGHPWIFSSDIADRDGAQAGHPVKVADLRGRPLGTAHYSSSSQISLRMLSR